ncbi:MAG: hybrid sensor histidine kinase/response regulator [bacterium]
MTNQEELMRRLLATFKDEAMEHLQAISSGLVDLERKPPSEERAKIVETVYREAHSLKGAARAVNLADIEALCRSMEDIFAGFKRGDFEVSHEVFDALYKALDAIGELVVTPGAGKAPSISALLKNLTELEASGDRKPSELVPSKTEEPTPKATGTLLGDREKEDVPLPPQSSESTPFDTQTRSSGTIRISTERLDWLLLQAEEMLTAKLAARKHASDLNEMVTTLGLWNKEWAKIQPVARRTGQILDKNKVDRDRRRNGFGSTVGKLLDFLEWNHSHVDKLKNDLVVVAQSAETDARLLDRMVDNLLEDMKQVLMLPFSSLSGLFPRMVRDLSRDAGKEVEFTIKGEEVEIDKRILEEIKDPLTHLLRNCIDHGVEKPEEREARGKVPLGHIELAVSRANGSKVEILISDDGRGVDLDAVKAAAVKEGIIEEENSSRLDRQAVLSLIRHSGVTTSPIITDISGRGLGLAIVQEKIERLDGTLSIETETNAGTSVKILLPLTLAAFRGVLIEVSGRIFVVPTTNVRRVLRIKRDEIKTIENRETIEWNGEVISLVKLDEVLELPRIQRPDETTEFVTAAIIGAGDIRVAFGVDRILNEQEVLIKRLGSQLSRVRNIAGATIRSSGEAVPVLNVPDLLKSAARVAGPTTTAGGPEEIKTKTARSILIVEDSITSRTLLKNILESSGFRVRTAVDGVDAMTALKTDEFDLVVSDIDMPRMDGFDLTAKIRSDEKLSQLPVVLVTSLEAREHRERGVEAGANAYIAKSGFDQSNLLETIDRLI